LGVCTCNKLLEWWYVKVTFSCHPAKLSSTCRHCSLHIA
jgi:hypothetical protein